MTKFEETYNRIMNEGSRHIESLYQQWLDDPDSMSRSDHDYIERIYRHGGDEELRGSQPRSRHSFPQRNLGEEFEDKNKIKRIMTKDKTTGKLFPSEKFFTSKKDGRRWERFFNGTEIKVRPA